MLPLTLLLLLPGEGRFFGTREVDFWGGRKAVVPAVDEDLWPEASAPPVVRRLLDAPSPENARAYRAWQHERLRRLEAALRALESVKDETPEILYFAREGCRWCALQERELEGLPVRRVPPESPLWKERRIDATPTLVVRGRTFRGFTPRAEILKGLGRD